MGIFVSDGVLPSGIPISNVYMSFSGSIVYIEPKSPDNMYILRTTCRVFKDQTKTLNSDINFIISTSVSDVSTCVFKCLYEKLKTIFPNSEDVI
jgi:hypothetical protein